MSEIKIRAEVFDGRGTANIVSVREFASGRTETIEVIGRVVGVHTEAGAIAAYHTEKGGGAR